MSGGNDAEGTAPRRRRRAWTTDEKRRIVDESLEDDASLAEVARRHDLNANQLFTWRRQFGVEAADAKDLAPILPVTITSDTAAEDCDPYSATIWGSSAHLVQGVGLNEAAIAAGAARWREVSCLRGCWCCIPPFRQEFSRWPRSALFAAA